MIRNTLALVVFLLTIVLLPGISSAGPNCPLSPGDGVVTTWTIDMGGNFDDVEAQAACTDGPAKDCSFYGAINRINNLANKCDENQLKSATLQLKFAPDITAINVPKDGKVLLKPPVNLRKIIVDGALSSGVKVVFKGTVDSTKTVFLVECPLAGAECGNVLDFTDIEFKNADFFGGAVGLGFNYMSAKGSAITISNVKASESNHWGVYIYDVKDLVLNVSTLEIAGGKTTQAFHVVNSSVKDGQLDGVKIEQLKTAGNYGLLFQNSSVDNLTIKNSSIASYSAVQFTNGTYNNIKFRNAYLNFGGYGLYFSGYGENISLVDSDLAGSNASIGVYLKSTGGLTNVSIKSDVGQTKISGVKKGIHINGIVQDVKVDGVTIVDTSSNAIFVETITNIEEPKKISYNNVKFENIAEQNNVVKLVSNTANAFTDLLVNPIATNLGLDTPPLTGKKIKLTRKEAKPQWLMLDIDYFKGCSEMELFLKKGMSLYPIKADSFGWNSILCADNNKPCAYVVETTFDKEHVSVYNNEDLDGLSIRLAMTCDGNTSMLSPDLKLIDAEILGSETITVDTSADDAALNACKDEVDVDCSLRGAAAYAKAKRDKGLAHHIEIKFKNEISNVSLSKTLYIDARNVGIDGGTGKVAIQASENFANQQYPHLISVPKPLVTLKSLALDGNKKVQSLVQAGNNSFVSGGVEFKNSPLAVGVTSIGHLEMIEPVFNNISNAAVLLGKDGSTVHLTGIKVKGAMPSKIISKTNGVAPSIFGSIPLYLAETPMTAEVDGVLAGLELVDAYVGFSAHPEWLLEPAGSYEPLYGADATQFEMKVSLPNYNKNDMVGWGALKTYLVGQDEVKEGNETFYSSTDLSQPATVYANLNEIDQDADGINDIVDNAPGVFNPGQEDADGDGVGDVADDDKDGDGVLNVGDNCAGVKNADQLDTDADGMGDACDDDIDGDGVLNADDNCPYNSNPDQATLLVEEGACVADKDKDSVRDDKDNCVGIENSDQFDSEGDGLGDACDDDIDGDGFLNASDNCPFASNADQVDADNDGIGDVCDPEPGITPSPPEQPAEGGGCSCSVCIQR